MRISPGCSALKVRRPRQPLHCKLELAEATTRTLDFSSWQAVLTTFSGPAIFTLVRVGIRVLMMQTVQQPRERMNRQINERLRTLIAAGGGGVGMSSGHRGDEHEAGDAPA